jgi:hypothetical protein
MATPSTRRKPAPQQPTGRPHLVRLTPSTVLSGTGAVVTVELTGDRFTATGNTVYFGSIELGPLPSNGSVIRFTVPETIPSRGEVPPMMVQPGRYDVHVVNANGVSDSLAFILKG